MNIREVEAVIKDVRECDEWLRANVKNIPVSVWSAAADGVIARRRSLLLRIKNETTIDVSV